MIMQQEIDREKWRLYVYERKMGFARGRDRISVPALPLSAVQEIVEDERWIEFREGQHWKNPPLCKVRCYGNLHFR
jgi:hypothetical protein